MDAVIFDMDGLMFDTESVFVKAWDYAGEKIGIGKAGYMTLKTLGMSIDMSNEVWVEEFGSDYDALALKKFTKEFLVDYYENNEVPIKKGFYNLLSYLYEKGLRLGVASCSPEWEVKKHLCNAGIYDKFAAIMCGDMVERSKPNPTIYFEVCKQLEVEPNQCYVLEDSRNGILSAHAVGCKVIMVPDLWQPDECIKDIVHRVCEDLDEVLSYFMEMNSF